MIPSSIMQSEETAKAGPHWHRPHMGEHRWPVALVVLLVISMQYLLPQKLSLSFQTPICFVEAALLLAVVIVNPKRISEHIMSARVLGVLLIAIMTLSNTASAVKLIDAIIAKGVTDARSLLLSGGSIWLTNVVVFGLWYWELDRVDPERGRKPSIPSQISCFLKCRILFMRRTPGIQISSTTHTPRSLMQVHLVLPMSCP